MGAADLLGLADASSSSEAKDRIVSSMTKRSSCSGADKGPMTP